MAIYGNFAGSSGSLNLLVRSGYITTSLHLSLSEQSIPNQYARTKRSLRESNYFQNWCRSMFVSFL